MPSAVSPPPTLASTPVPTSAPTALPPGSTFDLLPPLYETLQQLMHTSTSSTAGLHAADALRTAATRDLPAQIAAVKQRIVQARAAVAELPDVDRTLEEQEEEMRQIEIRIGRLREVWRGVRDGVVKGEGDMMVEGRAAERGTRDVLGLEGTGVDVKMEAA
jgi:hypothetical protein